MIQARNKRLHVLLANITQEALVQNSIKVTPINITSITRQKPPDHRPILVSRLNKTVIQPAKRKVQSLANFHYPMNIDLPNLVDKKIVNGTEITAKPINPHTFQYLHQPKVCSFSVPDDAVKILVLVKSAVSNDKLRESIRNTWAKDLLSNFHVVFLLGYTDNFNQRKVDKESKIYGDVIQEDFQDKYINNTFKTIMGFNWGVTSCPTASFYFFVDDDHYVFLDNVYLYLKNAHASKTSMFSGYLLPHSKPFRDIKSKWFVSWEDYAYDWWPPYLAGGAYLVSFSIAQKFQIAFPYVKYLGIDDSYLGIVANKLNIRPRHNAHLANRVSVVSETRIKRANMFASHGFKDPEKMQKVWEMIHTNDAKDV